MHATDIIGYSHDGDIYCEQHAPLTLDGGGNRYDEPHPFFCGAEFDYIPSCAQCGIELDGYNLTVDGVSHVFANLLDNVANGHIKLAESNAETLAPYLDQHTEYWQTALANAVAASDFVAARLIATMTVDAVRLAVGDGYGIYVAQVWARLYGRGSSMGSEDIAVLERGPLDGLDSVDNGHEHYDEVSDDIDGTTSVDDDGTEWTFAWANGSILMFPASIADYVVL